ncbi:hypothetical protein O1Q96_37640 [Streptomyces sp. Qhu-G9]|uniref:hypothetical protein n=1 Tax=Streptomyces sp. Qhu-G9 TaxID=3452799 RepID=UPI0022ABE835|nr:hypothetical protein [Streptomyces aurantiacus]WAU84918.1 hypothetical protein O1Q96_37640 [Streptomyces aurantiacus]
MTEGRSPVRLGLADGPDQAVEWAPWIGPFIVLGARLRRFTTKLDGRQLVVAVSVPQRDYAAALIASGWMLSSPAPELADPIEVFRASTRATYLRGVTSNRINTGVFAWLQGDAKDGRVLVADKLLPVARYEAVSELDGPVESSHSTLPTPGFLAQHVGASASWAQRMAAPPSDLVLIGTKKWLLDDLAACIGNASDTTDAPCPLSNYVLPVVNGAATWSTPVVSAPALADAPHLVEQLQAAILDGYGAIKHLNGIPAPIVVCVIDRSVADESAAETIMEARSSNSRPISMKDELHWLPPVGVEALAFTVAP